jgi:predicted Zn-dependent peptidase
LVYEAAFGEGSSLGAPIYSSNLQKLSVPAILDFRAQSFVRENMVVVASGISQTQLASALANAATVLPGGAAPAARPASFVGGEVRVRAEVDGGAHVAVAFPVPAGDAGKPYRVLKSLIGAKLASQQMCATTFLNLHNGAHGGLFGVEAAGAQAEAQLQAVVAELKAIASQCPDIEGAKQKVRSPSPSL